MKFTTLLLSVFACSMSLFQLASSAIPTLNITAPAPSKSTSSKSNAPSSSFFGSSSPTVTGHTMAPTLAAASYTPTSAAASNISYACFGPNAAVVSASVNCLIAASASGCARACSNISVGHNVQDGILAQDCARIQSDFCNASAQIAHNTSCACLQTCFAPLSCNNNSTAPNMSPTVHNVAKSAGTAAISVSTITLLLTTTAALTWLVV